MKTTEEIILAMKGSIDWYVEEGFKSENMVQYEGEKTSIFHPSYRGRIEELENFLKWIKE